METSYWSSVLTKRVLSRRRLISGAGGLASAGMALSLMGCGGSDSGSKESGSSLLGKGEDSTKEAKAGGTWPSSYQEDVINMDPILNNASPTFPQLIPVYSNLVKGGLNTTKRPGAEAITGDAAESWEFSPNGTRLTLRLRQGMKWDQRPPTSGRVLDSGDVKWSWDKFAAVGNSGPELVKSRNPDAPVETVEVMDPRTIVLKMAYPYSGILDLLSNYQNFYVMPRDETFNFKTDMRGSGPYYLDNFRPSSGATYKKNPDWYDKPRPYFDVLERTLISDYAQNLAQLKAKNIWNLTVLRQEDVLPTKRENPGMLMLNEKDVEANARFTNFSKRDDTVFKDARIRRALSMTLDRDLMVETFYNVKQFRDAGLPVELYWHSHIAAGLPEWLDPKGTALGEGAKYFQHNVAEAKKLVEAAGMKTPVAAPFGYFTDRAFDEAKTNEVLGAMMSEGGVFNIQMDGLLYDSSWRIARQSAGMGFSGLMAHRAAILSADVILTQKYTPNGRNSVSTKPVPGVTDLVLKQKTEFDAKKRVEIVQEIQKQLALEWPDLSWPGTAPGFTLRWPWLANEGVFIEGNPSAKAFANAWYDERKRTT
jgi:peptide/nickel transport system substrate-binding protein